LVEVLTQHLPEWQPAPNPQPVVPVTLPAPFLEIARQCLQLEPPRRICVADIAARMNPRAVAAAASRSASAPGSSPSVSPRAAAGQVSPRTPQPVASLPVPPRGAARMQHNPHRPPSYRESGSRPRFLLPLVVGALLVAAILTVPRLLSHRPNAKSAATGVPDKPASQTAVRKPAESAESSKPKAKPDRESAASQTAKSVAPAVPQALPPVAPAAAPDSLKTTSEREQPSPAASSGATAATRETLKPGALGIASAKGEVLDQVLPDVSQKARATIHGKVRVSVKVHVDPSGGVSEAEFDSPGPSRFFADLALQAARKWAFTPPEVNGKSVASEWRLRFEFTRENTKAIPRQTVP
jgi:protein TonB